MKRIHEHGSGDEPAIPDTEKPARKVRGVGVLSLSHRRRLLAALDAAAQSGDIAAQQALVELSLAAARDAQIAATLHRLKSEGESEA
jgi:hypothetical protein